MLYTLDLGGREAASAIEEQVTKAGDTFQQL
jgi:hypothetical protein